MIASFEVGAVFKIINDASPALAKILEQVRAINKAITQAKENMASLGVVKMPAGMSTAIGEADALAASWKNVAASARSARSAITNAGRASAGGNGGTGAAATVGGGRGYLGNRLGMGGRGGGGGIHVNSPNVGLPGGAHVRLPGGALGAVAAVGAYGVYQAMKYEDAAVLMANHAGVDYKENREKFEKLLKDATKETGYGEHEVSTAAQQELRMFRHTGGSGGVDLLPKMLRYAATEARLKGTSLEESMTSLTGLAHMTQSYNEKDVDKIVPAFSALSINSPMTLSAQERAFGYAVPLLHSAMELDPLEVMAASTGLARAGISSTKAGTWIREMMINSMPGTSLMSKMRYKKHEAALQEMGLVDKNHKPTWFVDGKPNMMKFLETTQENFPKIPIARRAAVATALEGKQGAGALAVLSEKKVREQVQEMFNEARDPANVNRMRNFIGEYSRDSSLQGSRQTLQTFNTLMADIGDRILPGVNVALGAFKSILEGIQKVLPGTDGKAAANVVGGGLLGTTLGAAGGFLVGGPAGAMAGGAYGAAGGSLTGLAVTLAANELERAKKLSQQKDLSNVVPNLHGGILKPPAAVFPGMTLNINLDSGRLATALMPAMTSQMTTGAPSANSMDHFNDGDHHQMDK